VHCQAETGVFISAQSQELEYQMLREEKAGKKPYTPLTQHLNSKLEVPENLFWKLKVIFENIPTES